MTTITDLFAGAGGSTTGAIQAPGVDVRIAANHWQLAVDTHNANHPSTDHACVDLHMEDPRNFPRTDMLWASPECTKWSVANSKAKALSVEMGGDPTLFDDVPGGCRMIALPIPRPWLLTSNHRLHWAEKAHRTRAIRQRSRIAARGQEQPDTPCRCVVTFAFPDLRRRDAGNLAPTAKAIVDGLLDAHLLPDDSTRYLTGVDTRIGGRSGGAEISVQVEFLPETATGGV